MPNSISYIFKQGAALNTPGVKQLFASRTYGMQGLLVKLGRNSIIRNSMFNPSSWNPEAEYIRPEETGLFSYDNAEAKKSWRHDSLGPATQEEINRLPSMQNIAPAMPQPQTADIPGPVRLDELPSDPNAGTVRLDELPSDPNTSTVEMSPAAYWKANPRGIGEGGYFDSERRIRYKSLEEVRRDREAAKSPTEQGVNGAAAAAPAPASPATPQSPGEVGAPPTQPIDMATLSDPKALITLANSPENVAKVVDVYNESAAQGAFNGASVSPDTLTKGVNLQQQIANLSAKDVQVFMKDINASQTAMAKEIRAGLEASGVNVPELIGKLAPGIETGEIPDGAGKAVLDQAAAAAGKTSEEGANDSNFLEGLFAMWEGLESSQKMGLMIGIPLVAIGLFSGAMGGGAALSAGLGLAGLAAGAAGMFGLFGGDEEEAAAPTQPPAPGQPVPPPAPGQPAPNQPAAPPAPGQPAVPGQPAAPGAGGGLDAMWKDDTIDKGEAAQIMSNPALRSQALNSPKRVEMLRSAAQSDPALAAQLNDLKAPAYLVDVHKGKVMRVLTAPKGQTVNLGLLGGKKPGMGLSPEEAEKLYQVAQQI